MNRVDVAEPTGSESICFEQFYKSVNTSKKREALSRGCALYSELFFEDHKMTKYQWEGKLTDAPEILIRSKARAEAAEKLKKDRAKAKREQIFKEELEKQLTEEDKQNGVLNATKQTQIIELQGKHLTLDVVKEYLEEQQKENDWIKKTIDTKEESDRYLLAL